MSEVRVLIVDDDAAARIGIAAVVNAHEDLRVVGQVASGEEVVEAVAAHRPDVVLMDIQLTAMDGIEALRELRRRPEPPHVLMLTAFDMSDYIVDAIEAGADGYVLKVRLLEELAPAIRAIMAGDAFLSTSSTKRLLQRVAGAAEPSGRDAERALAVLSDQERAVLQEMATGETNAEIGARLFMAPGTVKAHVMSIRTKLGLNRIQSVLLAERGGLLRDSASAGTRSGPGHSPGASSGSTP